MQFGSISKRKVLFAILSILFACMIFFFSSRNGVESTEDSYVVGMQFGHIVYGDFEQWQEEEQLAFAARVDHPVRKLAHATEYAVFAVLLCGAWYDRKRKKRYMAVLAWGMATGYAMTDEFHQLFVPGRCGQIKDVLLDSSGACAGVLLVLIALAIGQRISKKSTV